MTYHALATDFDGTIAFEGSVDDETLLALKHVRTAGMRLILVTGRELSDLFNTFVHSHLFDVIVAENGAVLYEPSDGATQIVGAPVPPDLIRILQEAKVPISVGHSIVATVTPYEHQVLAAIRELDLEWHVIFNKEAVMALPSDVTKATGLAVALKQLHVQPAHTVGVGDAENDQAFLRLCGLSVAVDNALPTVKEMVDVVTAGARGQGVQELVAWLLSSTADPKDRATHESGRRPRGERERIEPRQDADSAQDA
jgi:hydroxymethylpyrimidine pyrophosphatase-like HAD family hydrolase